jgi:hypothetical protein
MHTLAMKLSNVPAIVRNCPPSPLLASKRSRVQTLRAAAPRAPPKVLAKASNMDHEFGADIWDAASQVPSARGRALFASGYAAWLALNGASQAGWLGATNAEVSARFSTPLTPEG